MAIKGKAAKRRRPNSNPGCEVRGEDRLSTLPDDTLIEIISHLPLSSAVVTDSLSRRWHGLWTNISIDLSSKRRSGMLISKFSSVFRNDGEPIILPNLKKLSLSFFRSQHACIEKLIKTCSLLEDLSLKFEDRNMNYNPMIYSHQNLRRLSIQMDINDKIKVVINAPKLNYFNVYGRKDTIICLEEEPVALREANIQLDDSGWLCDKGKGLMTKFYEAISNVRFLRLDVVVLPYISNVIFSNATRLTIDMRNYYDIEIVSSLLEMCPALDVLIIKFGNVSDCSMWVLNHAKHDSISTLRRHFMWIEIEYFLPERCRPVKTFLALLEDLLFSSTIASEQFKFKLTGSKYCELGCVERKKRMELNLSSKVFNELPLASIQGEIDFVGEYFKMSRRAGPKERGASRKVIHFSCLSLDGFKI